MCLQTTSLGIVRLLNKHLNDHLKTDNHAEVGSCQLWVLIPRHDRMRRREVHVILVILHCVLGELGSKRLHLEQDNRCKEKRIRDLTWEIEH